LPTATTTIVARGAHCSAHPLPTTTTHQRGTTPPHDRCLATTGIYHALATTRELS